MRTKSRKSRSKEEVSDYELDVGLLEEIDNALNVAFNPQMLVQPPPFNAAVALEFLTEQISTEIQEGKLTGFSLQWDGGTHIAVVKTVKSETRVTTAVHDTHKIR